MSWEILQKNERSSRPSSFVPSLSIHKSGISFTKGASSEWIRGKRFAEILIDRDAKKIAFRFMDNPTPNAFKISKTGSRGPQDKITFKQLFIALGLKKPTRFGGTFNEKDSFLEVEFPAGDAL